MPDLYELASQFRARLLAQDAETIRALTHAWLTVDARLSARLGQLLSQIEKQQQAGHQVTFGWLIEKRRLESLQRQIRAEVDRFARQAEQRIAEQQRTFARQAVNDAAELFGAGLGDAPEGVSVSAIFNRLPVSAVESVAGFLSDGSPLSALLAELGPASAARVRESLLAGLALGTGTRQIAQQIRAALGGNLSRAMRIARTETMRAYRDATHESYKRNGDVLQGWTWVAGTGPRTCPVCWEMHGTVHPITEQLSSHPHCRCVAVPLTKSWAELGFSGVRDTRPKIERGDVLFRKLTPAEQRAILGKAKYEAWQRGEITLRDLVGYRVDPRWGPGRYERSLPDALTGPVPDAVPPVPPASNPPPAGKRNQKRKAAQKSLTADQARQRLEAIVTEFDELKRKLEAAEKQGIQLTREAFYGGPDQKELYHERLSALKDIQRQMTELPDNRNQKLRESLYQPTAAKFKVIRSSSLSQSQRETVDAGVEAFSQMIGRGWLEGRQIAVLSLPPGGARSYYNKGQVWLSGRAPVRTVVHEMAHWLEDESQEIFDRITQFYDRRTQGETPEMLKALLPRNNYRDDEMTRRDKFLHPYMGKVYEKNGRRSASEILSMGLEMFYYDPHGLAQADPDFFDFIYNLVRRK